MYKSIHSRGGKLANKFYLFTYLKLKQNYNKYIKLK